MNKQRLGILGLSVLGIIGSVTPWAKVANIITINGTKLFGFITLPLFLIIVIMAALGNRALPVRGIKRIATVILSLIVLAIAAISYVGLEAIGKTYGGIVSIGFGLILILLVSVVLLILPFVMGKVAAAPKEEAPVAPQEEPPAAPQG
jgi:hypothetical protein